MNHRPFLLVFCAFAAGICWARWMPPRFGYVCILIVAGWCLYAAFRSNKKIANAIIIILLTALGASYTLSCRVQSRDHIRRQARFYRTKPIAVEGVIVSAVRRTRIGNRTKYSFTMRAEKVRAPWGWKRTEGKVLVNLYRDWDLHYGDRVRFEGKIHQPFNFGHDRNFSYRDYLANLGIYHIISIKKHAPVEVLGREQGHWFRRQSLLIRQHLCSILDRHLSANESGLMKAILLGDRTSIPSHIRELFVRTGTAHILAISGLHIGIVAALFLVMVKLFPVGSKIRSAAVAVLLIGYAFMTGGRPSVVRATVMMVVFLMSSILEREREVLNTLGLAALIILVYNPMNLFDTGFQLSFVCVLAIILYGRLMSGFGKDDIVHTDQIAFERWMNISGRSLAVSCAIWVGVAGLTAYHFSIITPVTVLANLIVVPLISAVVALGLGLLTIGICLPICAPMFAACLKVTLNVMVASIFVLEKVPYAYIYLKNVSFWSVLAYYVALGAFLSVLFWRDRLAGIFHGGRIDKRSQL